MNRSFRSNITNTEAANEPLIQNLHEYAISFPACSQIENELQSSSVTLNGFLWWQRLAQITQENSIAISQNDLYTFRQNIEQAQKNREVIQLLRSWREGDEQEQKETWEYLKHALDEDRPSERKLFP